VVILFVCGLLFVSVVKNKTRNLEKEINSLRASNNVIKYNLNQAILDNEVITSPENISRLAKEYLNTDFISYKKSQIRQLYDDTAIISKLNKKNNNLSTVKLNEKSNNLSTKIKSVITKKIEKKKTEIRKLQELYSKPESIPGEIKTQVAKKIEEKKIIYDHSVDQRKNKWDSETTLRKIELSEMPDYLSENYKKYTNWLEI